jgi:hypothetical protein
MNMKKILFVPLAAFCLLFLSACCCTGEDPAPKLRSLPAFAPVPGSEPAPAYLPEQGSGGGADLGAEAEEFPK